jgi:hypothetical protein
VGSALGLTALLQPPPDSLPLNIPLSAASTTFSMHDVRFEEFFKITVEWIGAISFPHLLKQFPQTVKPLSVEL